ncbi:hypothetical protein OHB33_41130 (plasmid) [Streptomyces sp. NBC_01558]|uniref:hypothetical protein n=1 Tax=Streptomyces sp. NBC_01558 TaxID=2975878 RepID=UPI002DD92806|nr:hypothetical protein [Streptomyces sp. NBC_01558]WSD82790.1 hypothetical protein OHB33_41130 [Streptomyces sp. NBC_01558]
MKPRPIVVITVTATVFAWSALLVAAGQTTAVIALAPALALSVQQIVQASRSQPSSRSNTGTDVAADEEGEAP